MPTHDRSVPFDDEQQSVSDESEPTDEVEEDDGEVPPAKPDVKDEPSEGDEVTEEGDGEAVPEETASEGDDITKEDVPAVETTEQPPKKPDEPLESLQKTRTELEQEIAEALEADPSLEAKLDVQMLRRIRRIAKAQPFQKKEEKPVFIPQENDDLKDINPGDAELIEKVLKAKGYVPKAELERERAVIEYSSRMNVAIDSWMKENPEFNEENDPDGSKWQKIKAYVEAEFDSPKNPEKVKTFLNDAKNELFPKKSLPKASPHSIAAQKEKIAASAVKSSGSGAPTKTTSSAPSRKEALDPELKGFLHGFSDEELKDL